jgi:uncharacterized protein (DUF885 family)
MHALGWPRQKALDYLLAHTGLAEDAAKNEIDRYIIWPGQALAYKIGQLEILRIREEARKTMGGDFDLKAFHDHLLSRGAIPVPTLKVRMERWKSAFENKSQEQP